MAMKKFLAVTISLVMFWTVLAAPDAGAQDAAEHFAPVQPQMGPEEPDDGPSIDDWYYPVDESSEWAPDDPSDGFDHTGGIDTTYAPVADPAAGLAALIESWTVPEATDLEDFIIGGSNAFLTGHPHQVGVYSSTGNCGGSLIRADWVLTAAHCVDRRDPGSTVFVGAGVRTPFPGGQINPDLLVRSAVRVVIHPAHPRGTLDWDVALLKLNSPLPTRPTIRPIALATSAEIRNARSAVATGWGQIVPGPTDIGLPTAFDRGLRQVSLPLLPDSRCSFYNGFRPLQTLCTGGPGTGRATCVGDSGGPLTIQTPRGRRLAGVASWAGGETCTAHSGFVDVTAVRRWVFNVLPKRWCDGRRATVDASLGMLGTSRADVIAGGPNGEFIRGFQGNDRICGGGGNDRIEGGLGWDRLFGNRGNDQLFGNQGNDRLDGGFGTDTVYGGLGRDTCVGWERRFGCP